MDPLRPDDPRQFGSYRLVGRLGAGGMGRVYLARSPGGRTVAVKVVRAELAEDANFRRRFRHEVDIARAVSGRYTAPVVDADTEAEMPWLATQYVSGPSLSEVVDGNGPLPERTVRALGAGLSAALSDLHAAGLIHRDLKPSNVLLAADGPRVIDFGIARAVDGDHLTQTGVVMGSPAYMPPEQALGHDTAQPGDVFSLGSVLAFAATGRNPFGNGALPVLLYQVVHGEPDLAGMPEAIEPVVRACLAKNPVARPGPDTVLRRLEPHGLLQAFDDWLPGAVTSTIATQASQLLDLDTPPEGLQPARGQDAAREAADSGQGSPYWQGPGATVGAGAAEGTMALGPGPGPGRRDGVDVPGAAGVGVGGSGANGAPGAAGTDTSGTGGAGKDASATGTSSAGSSRRRFLGIAAGAAGVLAVGGGTAVVLSQGAGGQEGETGGPGGGTTRTETPARTPSGGAAPRPLWRRTLDTGDLGTIRPLVLSGNIHVAGAPVRALNIRTQKLEWERELTNPNGGHFVHDSGIIYFGSGEHDGALVGVSAKSEKEAWRARLPERFEAGTPLATDGTRLYVLADIALEDKGKRTNAICAIDLRTREKVWHRLRDGSTKRYGTLRVQAVSGYLVYGDDDGNVAVRETAEGRRLWSKQLGEKDHRPDPAVAKGTVFVDGSTLCAYDLDSGKQKWELSPNGRGGFRTPQLFGGTLYVFDRDGGFWAVDPVKGRRIWLRDDLKSLSGADEMVKAGGTIYAASSADDGVFALDAETGEHRWTFTGSGTSRDGWHVAATQRHLVALHGRELYVLPAV